MRRFQARMTRTTAVNAAKKITTGMIQATRLKPVVVGAASTAGPYLETKPARTTSSESPRSRARLQFLAHLLGGRASHVIALEQNLAAAALAHQVVAKAVKALAGAVCRIAPINSKALANRSTTAQW